MSLFNKEKTMKKYSTILSVLVAALSVIFMGCATNKHKAKEIETEMEGAGDKEKSQRKRSENKGL